MPDFNLQAASIKTPFAKIKVHKRYAVQEGDARMMTIASKPGPKKIATKNPILFRMGFRIAHSY
jgi:hypothetical protein